MIIYYILSILATVALIIYAPEHLLFNYGSICVFFIIVLMIFMSIFYKKHSLDKNLETAYGSSLNTFEPTELFKMMSLAYAIYIPLCLPFFFFLIAWKKTVAVTTLYLLASISGPLLYRIKHGKATKEIISKENKELQEQIHRENNSKM